MIRQVVREDALLLYGFSSATEKRAFDLLMSVQHVGPKLALAILSVLAPEELVAAIGSGDIERIDAVPGVGPKVAERVVRELRDKVADLKMSAPSTSASNGNIRPTARGQRTAGRSCGRSNFSAGESRHETGRGEANSRCGHSGRRERRAES